MKQIMIKDEELDIEPLVTKEEWKQILSDESFMSNNYRYVLIAFFLESDHKATCRRLANKYNSTPFFFNSLIMSFSKSVKERLNRFEIIKKDGSQSYWRITMTGTNVIDEGNVNLFEWQLRDELVNAVIELDFVRQCQIPITSLSNLVKQLNKDLGDFKKKFLIARKELVGNQRMTNSSILFKYDDDTDRDWAINEGAGTEVQFHIYLVDNEIGYGLGFNTLYVRFKDDKTPIEYVKPFMDAFTVLRNEYDFYALDDRGFELNKTLAEFENPVENEHYLYGRVLNIEDGKLSLVDYYKILNDLKGDLFTAYQEIFKKANELQSVIDNANEEDKLAAEKVSSIEHANSEIISKNIILYGPPGTGKTYYTTELAVQCVARDWYYELNNKYLDEPERREFIKAKYDELIAKGRIAFTTFHQSFSYEDFVEGIRPIVVEGIYGSSNISYEVVDGIFKQLCTNARTTEQTGYTQAVNIEGKNIWKLSLGDTNISDENEIFNECIDNNYVLLGWGDDIDFSNCSNRREVVAKIEQSHNISLADDPNNYKATAVNTFKNAVSIGDLVIISDGNHKFRAIAEVTDDYEFLDTKERSGFQQLRKVKWLRIYSPSLPKERLFDKSLSQMTIYQLRNTTINREKLKQLLTPEPTTNSSELPHLLIIDEINRGNISRIFGELITLLEPDKRKGGTDAREVILPYSKLPFSVPSNLHVLGTMNTADKSLAQLDLALRRRFDFIELLPKPELLDGITVHGIAVSEILTVINQRIEVLLDREHTIGHSYFWSLKHLDSDDEKEIELGNIFKRRIIPLLQEYFFSDWERIGWVLNDPSKHNSEQFIQTGSISPAISKLFDSSINGLNDRRYHINETAFNNPESYKKILIQPKFKSLDGEA